MSITIEKKLDTLSRQKLTASFFVKEMKAEFGTRCLPLLIALIGDEDVPITVEAVMSQYRITSQVRAMAELKLMNVVVDEQYVQTLEQRAFWKLELHQCKKLYDHLLTCFPTQFQWLYRHFGHN